MFDCHIELIEILAIKRIAFYKLRLTYIKLRLTYFLKQLVIFLHTRKPCPVYTDFTERPWNSYQYEYKGYE